MNKAAGAKAMTPDIVASTILSLRGQKVLLDATLASLYRVKTKALNQAVRRNRARFPADFMFRLTAAELADLRSHIVTSSSRGHGGRRTRPYAFTEQGVAMLSSVLKSPRAIAVNVEIMRAFVRLRSMLAAHAELAARIDALEQKYDRHFRAVFQAIRQLIEPARLSHTDESAFGRRRQCLVFPGFLDGFDDEHVDRSARECQRKTELIAKRLDAGRPEQLGSRLPGRRRGSRRPRRVARGPVRLPFEREREVTLQSGSIENRRPELPRQILGEIPHRHTLGRQFPNGH
jgi:hypothetical protein